MRDHLKPVNNEETICTGKTLIVSNYDVPVVETVTRPLLVLQYQGCVETVILFGNQIIGRPTSFAIPDIPVNMPFVSRKHGLFHSDGLNVTYTALPSTNGTYYRGKRLGESECVELKSGDSLHIIAERGSACTDVIMECAFSAESQKTWTEIVKNQYDALTKLMNRKLFSQWSRDHGIMEEGMDACLFILDLDHFKQINDTYGHLNGDRALVTLSRTLEAVLGPYGKAGRWGGDEFVGIIFADLERSLELMKTVQDRLRCSRVNDLFSISVSVGLVEYHAQDGFDLPKLLSQADMALYRAKKSGRNQIASA